MELGRREDASTSSVGLAIAAATVAAAFIVAEIMVAPPSGLDARASALSNEAATALHLIVREAGLTSSGSSWGDDADNMTRFGLTVAGQPNFLDYTKIRALRNGTHLSNGANGAPDYPEVRGALGLVDSDLHLRSYPVLPGLDDPRWVKDQNGRLGYFGHYASASAPVTITQASVMGASHLNVSLTLRNDHSSDAVYVVALSLGDKDTGSTIVTEERHTRLLRPGESQTVWAHFHRLPNWDASIDAVKATVTDSYGGIALSASGIRVGQFWFSERPPTGAGPYNLLLAAAKTYYVSGETVTFNADHYDGAGAHVSNAKARFVLVAPNGTEVTNQTVDLPRQKNAVWSYDCSACTAVGNYTARLWDTGMTRVHVDVVHVAEKRMFTERRNLDPIAAKEAALLSELVVNFTPTRYDARTNPQGDIFGDDSNGPGELANELHRYTTVIIGSEVAQTALTPAHTKYAIADWVQAGGNLIVLGTFGQESRWIEPIYRAAQETANGGISAPDPTHPVLSAPNPLQYHRYLDRARTWRIDSDTQFTHVLTRGAGPQGEMDDTLAVSDPGAFNNGTVVLTSYMPGALTDPQDDQEAKRFLHNLLSQAYTMLFLDYGPPIPEGVPVGSASRLVAVPHPNVPGAVVEVRLVMYLFG